MFSNYIPSRGNMTAHSRSTAGCTFGTRLSTPNSRYLNDLIDDYYEPGSQQTRRRSRLQARSRSASPASIRVSSRGSSMGRGGKASSRASSTRSASTKKRSNTRERDVFTPKSYPPWYTEDDIRRFELVRRIREEKRRIPKNSDKYSLVSGLSRPTSASSRASSRSDSQDRSPQRYESSIWDPSGCRATRRDANKTVHRLVHAQNKAQRVMFNMPTAAAQPTQSEAAPHDLHESSGSSDSCGFKADQPRLSTLKFYGRLLGTQAAPTRRARRLQSLLDETAVFYAPNGDTVLLSKSDESDSPETRLGGDPEHLAHDAISGLMNLISQESCRTARSARRRFSQDYMREFERSSGEDDIIDLSRPHTSASAQPAPLEERLAAYTQRMDALNTTRRNTNRDVRYAVNHSTWENNPEELHEASRRLKSYSTNKYYRDW